MHTISRGDEGVTHLRRVDSGDMTFHILIAFSGLAFLIASRDLEET